MDKPPDSAMVLSVFYTIVILLIVERVLYDLVRSRPEVEPDLLEDSYLATEFAARYNRPIILLLEEENKVLYELFGDEYRTDLCFIEHHMAVGFKYRPCPWNLMLVANRVPMSPSDKMLIQVRTVEFICRFEADTGLPVFRWRE